jgi:carboxypeptidase A2
MKYIIVFLLCLSVCLGQKTRYDDYSVQRLYSITEDDIQNFYDLNVDVWAQSKTEGWVDVMLHNDQLPGFLASYPQYKTIHANVQDEIDREELAQQQQNNVSSPGYFTYFPTNDDVTKWLKEQVDNNPGLAQSLPIGTSYLGKSIEGIRIGRNPSAPLIWIHCTIHAREWITTTTCCLIIEDLLGKDIALTDRFTFIIVPILNPDGYEYSHTNTRLWRKNRQPNSGGCIGTDLNRNYAVGWGGTGSSPDPCSDIFRGTAAFTAPETDAEENYLVGLQNVIAFVDIHAYGGQFMSPWGWTTAYPDDYDEMYRLMQLAQSGIYNTGGYEYDIGTSARVIYIAAGGSDDWAYGTTSRKSIVPSYTIEARGSSFIAPVSSIVPVGSEIWAGCKAMILGIRSSK